MSVYNLKQSFFLSWEAGGEKRTDPGANAAPVAPMARVRGRDELPCHQDKPELRSQFET